MDKKLLDKYIEDNYAEEQNICGSFILEDKCCSIEGIEADFKVDSSFSDELLKIIDSKGLKDSDCYKKAQIDRRLFSKIRSGHKPGKDTCISLCIALELNLDETNNLLEKAGYILSNSILKDVIISFFIEKQDFDLDEINDYLFEYGEDTLSNY